MLLGAQITQAKNGCEAEMGGQRRQRGARRAPVGTETRFKMRFTAAAAAPPRPRARDPEPNRGSVPLFVTLCAAASRARARAAFKRQKQRDMGYRRSCLFMRAFAAAVASAKTALGSAVRRHALPTLPRSLLFSPAIVTHSHFLGSIQPSHRSLSSAASDTIDVSFLAGGDIVHCKVSPPARPRSTSPPHLDTLLRVSSGRAYWLQLTRTTWTWRVHARGRWHAGDAVTHSLARCCRVHHLPRDPRAVQHVPRGAVKRVL